MSANTPFLGTIASFDHEQQDWTTYHSRLQQWFIANDINDNTDKTEVKRRAILLSVFSETSYQLASNLVLPKTLEEVSYKEIVKVLGQQFTPKRCGFAERHHFYAAQQGPGESHAQWAARLRGLAAHCKFKDLGEQLLDKFVVGMLPGPEREKLYSMDIEDLTLTKAVDIAQSVKCARAAAASASAGSSGSGAPLFKIDKGTKSTSNKMSRESVDKCLVCGQKSHKSSECRFIGYRCKKCKNKGHLRRMCNSVKFVESGEASEGDDGEFFNIRCRDGAPMIETVMINNLALKFEIDSGSSVTAISDVMYRTYFSDVPLLPSKRKLISYTGSRINSLGMVKLPVRYSEKTITLDVHVIEGGGPPLLGRDFITKFDLELSPIKGYDVNMITSTEDTELKKILNDYSDVFSDQLGCFKKYKIKLHLKSDAKPIFFKARPVAFALREKLDKEIERLVQTGVIEPVDHSDYASPIVPVLKRDGTVRLCADYSQTLNKQLLVEKYPLPTVQELFAQLHGGVQFTKLDMSSAYNQFQIIDDDNVTCINTHKGLFKYKRLIFGLSSAPAIFQRAIESILKMEGVLCFLDDVLITGKDRHEHMDRLRLVLQNIQAAGLKLRKDKCEFFKDEITYLGYVIDKQGIKKSTDKVKAIVEAPVPTNVNQLQSFLGLVNYYRNFVPGASSLLSPLYDLLKKDSKWVWSADHDRAFCEIKNHLASDSVLAHFDMKAQIILTVDASSSGLGAILSQVGSDGLERPVSFASRTLNAAEKKYSQIQKEATAIIFGVRRFHQFLYGRSEAFILRTDHKPLVSIFGPNTGVPEVTANRLQRYAIFLSAYNYRIEYVRSADNSADYLSRATLGDPAETGPGGQQERQEGPDLTSYVNFVVEGTLPITMNELEMATNSDRILIQVKQHVQNGWPRKVSDTDLKPYFQCKWQLAIENGCLLRGHKVIIPSNLREKILSELHESHLGIVKSKALARSKFWFPGIDAAIENYISKCPICISVRPSPPRARPVPWTYPMQPFERVHLDLLGPIANQMYLIIVDAHTKWVECYNMKNNITSSAIINKMSEYMSRFGIPRVLVSDNGTSLTSEQFNHFCKLNGIAHVTSPVYNPASNGQAESFVKIVKKGIKCALLLSPNKNDIDSKLLTYLFHYRNSVHTTTGHSPAYLLYGRQLRSRLDLITPHTTAPPSLAHLSKEVYKKQCLQSRNQGPPGKKFFPGDRVFYKHYQNNNKFIWTRGTIVEQLGKIIYTIKDRDSGMILKRHHNQIINDRCDERVLPSPLSGDNGILSDPFPLVTGEEGTTAATRDPPPPGLEPASTEATGAAPQAGGNSQSPHSPPQRSTTDDVICRGSGANTNIRLRNIPRVDYKPFL